MTRKGIAALPFKTSRALLLAGMLILAACSAEETGKVDNIQLARFYADNGTYTLALSTLGQERQKTPDDPRIYHELARIYHDLGYMTDALAEIDKAIARGCDSDSCRELRLRILIAAGKPGEADAELGRIGNALPPERRDFYRTRITLLKTGDRVQALERLKGMQLAEARSEYLRLLFAERRYPEIIEIYEKRKGKESPVDDWLVFAKTLYLLKRHEEADRVLIKLRLADKSDVITPRKIQAVELQVKNNIAQNKFAEAQAIYEAFLENYKGSGYVALQEAVKDLKSRNFDSAIKNIEALVEASPDNLQSAMILALAQFGKGNYRAVIDTLSLFRDKLQPPGRSLLAKAYLNLGQADPVLELIPGDTGNPALQLDLASAFMLKGQAKRARRLLDGMDASSLKDSEFLQYAQLLEQQGDRKRLIQALIDRESEDPRLQRMLVTALVKEKRLEEAERYARAVKDPRQSLELQVFLALQQKDRARALELQKQLTADRQLKSDDARLAALYLANQQIDEGFGVIKRGFSKPGDNTAFLKMLRILLQKEDRPEIRKWMASQPSSVNGHDELQLLLAQSEMRDNPKQARNRLKPLVDRNDPRAVVLMAKSDPDNGVTILNDALERKYDPLIARLLYQYYLKKGDRESLKLLLERIESQQADGPEKDLLLARGYLRAGDLTRALGFADALEKKGLESQAHELRGDAYLAAGRAKQAVQSYASALALNETDALAAKLFQTRVVAGESPAEVLKEAEQLLRKRPRFTTLKGFVAASYLQSRPDQARKLYEQIVKEQGNNVTALNNLAWLHLEQDPGRALELSGRALRLAPGNLNVADTYIRALDRSGQGEKARQMLQRLREKNPDSRILQQLARELT